jgi:hypothetical protein
MMDVASGPLQFVGMGSLPGSYLVLQCLYKNERVLVVDPECLPGESTDSTRMTITVHSPTRGSVSIWARANNTPLLPLPPSKYEAFGVASYFPAPDAVQPRISLSMSDRDLVAHQEAMTKLAGERRKSKQPQEPRCMQTSGKGTDCSGMDPKAFATTAEPFVKNPPPGWQTLLKTMFDLRGKPHPVDLSAPARLAEIGAVYARVHDCYFEEHRAKRVGNTEGFFAPLLALSGGELLMVGTKTVGDQEKGSARLVRATGTKVGWEKLLASPPKEICSGESLAKAADGDYLVYGICGTAADIPLGMERVRIQKVAHDGKVRWSWLAGKGEHASFTQQLLPDGTISLVGHTNAGEGDAKEWSATVSASGKTLKSTVGGPYVYKGE